jgi:hypothetical protein
MLPYFPLSTAALSIAAAALSMFPTKTLENLAKRYLPMPLAQTAKRLVVYPRYYAQARACSAGYRQFGDRYSQHVLFVAGLPKSGTTWLERMISSYPGFHELLIPDVAAHELATGGSHDYDLPDDIFSRFRNMLVLTKMHVYGSPHNVRLLREAGVRYAVLFRDLRDVAISHFYYVRQTPWHPECRIYGGLSLSEGLAVFAERTLPAYVEWVRSWHENIDPNGGIIIRYEQMLEDATGVLTRLARHFELDDDPKTVASIVDAHSFKRLSAGRTQGQESDRSFFRKGVAGDWKNHFTDELREIYKRIIGDYLVEFGYEEDLSW